MNNDTNQEKKRGRGRPKGSKSAPKPIVWVCSEVVDSELVTEQVEAHTAQEARDIFNDKYGAEPSNVLGPYHISKSEAIGIANIPAENIRFGKERRDSVFNGWHGVAFDLENNPDAVYFIFIRPIVSGGGRKHIPTPKVVFKSAIKLL